MNLSKLMVMHWENDLFVLWFSNGKGNNPSHNKSMIFSPICLLQKSLSPLYRRSFFLLLEKGIFSLYITIFHAASYILNRVSYVQRQALELSSEDITTCFVWLHGAHRSPQKPYPFINYVEEGLQNGKIAGPKHFAPPPPPPQAG